MCARVATFTKRSYVPTLPLMTPHRASKRAGLAIVGLTLALSACTTTQNTTQQPSPTPSAAVPTPTADTRTSPPVDEFPIPRRTIPTPTADPTPTATKTPKPKPTKTKKPKPKKTKKPKPTPKPVLQLKVHMPPEEARQLNAKRGRVTKVYDGDTVQVKFRNGKRERVRYNSIQAMELTKYSTKHPSRIKGYCGGRTATLRLRELVLKKDVLVTAQKLSSQSRGRIKRNIAVKQDGKWVDTGLILVREGWALPFTGFRKEHIWNRTYLEAAANAAAERKGLWNPTLCSPKNPTLHGTAPDTAKIISNVKVTVVHDPSGSDKKNEHVVIENLTDRPLQIGKWLFRDESLEMYTFPKKATIKANDSITLYVRSGKNTKTKFFWGANKALFNNPRKSLHTSDGGYLFDKHGSLQAWDVYSADLDFPKNYSGNAVSETHTN
jgi:micrococcal nuclease